MIHELRLYLDTSVLAACYHREPFSDEANGILALAKRPAISPLVELEMASALARKQRSGELSLRQAYDIEDLSGPTSTRAFSRACLSPASTSSWRARGCGLPRCR